MCDINLRNLTKRNKNRRRRKRRRTKDINRKRNWFRSYDGQWSKNEFLQKLKSLFPFEKFTSDQNSVIQTKHTFFSAVPQTLSAHVQIIYSQRQFIFQCANNETQTEWFKCMRTRAFLMNFQFKKDQRGDWKPTKYEKTNEAKLKMNWQLAIQSTVSLVCNVCFTFAHSFSSTSFISTLSSPQRQLSLRAHSLRPFKLLRSHSCDLTTADVAHYVIQYQPNDWVEVWHSFIHSSLVFTTSLNRFQYVCLFSAFFH